MCKWEWWQIFRSFSYFLTVNPRSMLNSFSPSGWCWESCHGPGTCRDSFEQSRHFGLRKNRLEFPRRKINDGCQLCRCRSFLGVSIPWIGEWISPPAICPTTARPGTALLTILLEILIILMSSFMIDTELNVMKSIAHHITALFCLLDRKTIVHTLIEWLFGLPKPSTPLHVSHY